MQQQLAAVWGMRIWQERPVADSAGSACWWYSSCFHSAVAALQSTSLLLSNSVAVFLSALFPPLLLLMFLSLSLSLKINHKYPERRLLVAESCGALAPYLPVRTYCAHRMKTGFFWCRWLRIKCRKVYSLHPSCSLSPQKEIRSSLVLSMLQQMLAEDKADMVREAVIKSLGIIMGYIDDPDKYSQVCVRREKCPRI